MHLYVKAHALTEINRRLFSDLIVYSEAFSSDSQ